jgi:hypothetical protein
MKYGQIEWWIAKIEMTTLSDVSKRAIAVFDGAESVQWMMSVLICKESDQTIDMAEVRCWWNS